MTHERPPDVDRRLRDAFPRDTHAVSRVIRGALASDARQRVHWRMALAGGFALALLAAVLGVWPARPVPAPSDVTTLSGSFARGLLVLSMPDGSVSISDGGTREDRPPDGYGILLVEGELK